MYKKLQYQKGAAKNILVRFDLWAINAECEFLNILCFPGRIIF